MTKPKRSLMRRASIAAVTFTAAGALWNTVLPSQEHSKPVGQQHKLLALPGPNEKAAPLRYGSFGRR